MFILLKAKDIGMGTSAVILLYVLYNVVYSAASLPLGGLSDRVGQYPLVLTGYALFAAVYLGFAAAGSGWTMAALFAAYGLYIAATEGTSKALIGRAIPTGERASALGLYYTATGLASFAASTAGRAALERRGAVGDLRVRGGGGRGRRRPDAARPRQGATGARGVAERGAPAAASPAAPRDTRRPPHPPCAERREAGTMVPERSRM